MRASLMAGPVLLCGLAAALGPNALAQDYSRLPYPGDPPPPESTTYVTLRGSLAFAGKDGVTSVGAATLTDLRGAHDVGGGAAIALGMTMPLGLRVEAEGLFRRLPETSATLGGPALGFTIPASGFRDVAAVMGNVFWDLPVGDFPVHPFVGIGGGMAYTHGRLWHPNATNINLAISDPVPSTVYMTNSSWRFAWQTMAGVTVPVAPGARLSAMYRYMQVNGVSGKCGNAGLAPALACRGDNADHSVDLGLELDLP